MTSKTLDYVKLLRPKQWLKQGFILLPVFFGLHFTGLTTIILLKVLYLMVSFSLAASSIYIFNDLLDLDFDRQHPKKKFRPIASGEISEFNAIGIMWILFLVSVGMATALGWLPAIIIFGYIMLMINYSKTLKHIPIVDVIVVAIGFVIRVVLGGIVACITISNWLIVMTFLLTTFIALSKRRNDLTSVSDSSILRPVMVQYNLDFINGAMIMMSTITIVAYLMYTMSVETVTKFGSNNLWITSFFVVLGILKYMHMSFFEQKTASPTEALLKDKFLMFTIIGWIITWIIFI